MKAILAAIAIATAVPAAAVTITFDDLSTGFIANGYQGFNWSNFYAYNPGSSASGYTAGVVSPAYVALGAFAAPATLSSSTSFSLTNGYLTGAWNDGLTVVLTGKLGSATIFTQSFVVSATAPTLETFNHATIDSVVFSSFGGTHHAGYGGGSGTHFALDNLTINGSVPEPASWAMMLGGFALVGAALRRRTTTVTFA